MSRRRLVLAAAATVLVAVVLVLVGRWEGDRTSDEQNRGMRRVLALVGRLDSPALDRYRLHPMFNCLLYRVGAKTYALELCFDAKGRLVEAIDRRRGGDPRIWSLRFDPEASDTKVDPAEVQRLLRKLGPIESS